MARECVLVVEDCPINLKLMRILLTNEGYEVLAADSGVRALEVLRGCRPDLVLADIQMPGMDGLTLTRRIKQDEATRTIPVIALTALAMKGDREKAMEAGCDGYITKPIEVDEIRRQIRKFLDGGSAPEDKEARCQTNTPAPIQAAVLDDLRHRFLQEGGAEIRQWLAGLEDNFSPSHIAHKVHQWVGSGALLGFRAISTLARETEMTLRDLPIDQGQLRDNLISLCAELDAQQTACSLSNEAV